MTINTTRINTLKALIGNSVDLLEFGKHDNSGDKWEWIERIENGESACYSNFSDVKDDNDKAIDDLLADSSEDAEKKDLYIIPRYASGSDYSGGTVERSNYLALCEEFDDYCVYVSGGHGSYAIAFSVRWLCTDSDDSDDDTDAIKDNVLNILSALEDYPCIDECALSDLESELSDQAWNSWASGDFQRAIEKRWNVELDFTDDAESSADAFRAMFERVRDDANIYWENGGSGYDMWVDVDRVVENLSTDDIGPFVQPERIRVLCNGEWFCDGWSVLGEFEADVDLYQDIFDRLCEDTVEIDGKTYTWQVI